MMTAALVSLALAQPTAPPPAPPAPSKALVAFPHPLITEILYAVPTGPEGDADGSGDRSATGDEFVEIINPHDKPINLKGYIITDGKPGKGPDSDKPADKTSDKAARPDKTDKSADKSAPKKKEGDSRVHFVFPDLTLQPGEVVVVFNGYQQSTPGPVGDKDRAASKNDKFHNAYVFSMKVESQYIAYANAGDCVLLSAPDGAAVECVSWGKSDKTPDSPAALTERAPEGKGSVQRESLTGKFTLHKDLKGEYAGKLFSPGRFGDKEEAKPK